MAKKASADTFSNQSIKLNVLANFLGRGWTALLGVLLVPVYVRIIGIEAYGLIGAFAALQALLGLLDFGLSTTLNREMARSGGGQSISQRQRELVYTLEIIYWVMSGLILLVMLGASPIVAKHWVQARSLAVDDMILAGGFMGLIMALQWPQSLYNGGILGLEKHVQSNLITGVINLLKYVGILPVLWFVSPTLEAYLGWQALVAALGTFTMRVALWRLLPSTSASYSFSWERLREVWRFAAGMNLIALLTIPLSQLDRIILSRILSLEAFGYYTVAIQVASVTSVVITPIFTAYFPRFSYLVSCHDIESLRKHYHAACQFVAAIITPMVFILACFSLEILQVWSGNIHLAKNVAPIAAILLLGNMINGYMNIPYALTLAHGWTRFTIVQNALIATVIVPVMIWSALQYGAIGAALVWVAVNFFSVMFGTYFLHRRLIPDETFRWYLMDVSLPVTISVLCLVPVVLLRSHFSTMQNLLIAGGGCAGMIMLLLFALPDTRNSTVTLFRRISAAIPFVRRG